MKMRLNLRKKVQAMEKAIKSYCDKFEIEEINHLGGNLSFISDNELEKMMKELFMLGDYLMLHKAAYAAYK